MKQTYYERVGESVYREVLPNGLQICVVPKPEHAKKYAFFATRYGGMDTRFCLDGKWLDTPAGIAHYLEHKMFDTKEGNALQELAKNGAEPNAFTDVYKRQACCWAVRASSPPPRSWAATAPTRCWCARAPCWPVSYTHLTGWWFVVARMPAWYPRFVILRWRCFDH